MVAHYSDASNNVQVILHSILSWSGDRSCAVGEILKNWIPDVIQAVEVWIATEDIAKGARWAQELGGALEECDFGLSVVTPENMQSPWLLYEAGAISKSMVESRVYTLLMGGLKFADVVGPLAQFQHTEPNEKDFFKLMQAINRGPDSGALGEQRLRRLFEKSWDELDRSLNPFRERGGLDPVGPQDKSTANRPEAEKIDEILSRVRNVERQVSRMDVGRMDGDEPNLFRTLVRQLYSPPDNWEPPGPHLPSLWRPNTAPEEPPQGRPDEPPPPGRPYVPPAKNGT